MSESSAAAPEPEATPSRAHNPWVAGFVAWLVPGAGHLMIGRRACGVAVALGTWPIFIGGLALTGFECVHVERHPYLLILQALAGAPAGAALLLTRGVELTEPWRHHTAGELFTCAAGLLNLIAVSDVVVRCTSGDPETRPAAEPPASVEELVGGAPSPGEGVRG